MKYNKSSTYLLYKKMCYIIIISTASPDYKRPSVNTHTKIFNTLEEAEEYKRDCAENFLWDYGIIIENAELENEEPTEKELNDMITKLWEGEYDDFIYSDSYMENNVIEATIIQCTCSTKNEIN